MGHSDQVEASSAGGERIHPKQNKRDKSLLNTPQGSSEQTCKGEAVCHKAVVRGHRYRVE